MKKIMSVICALCLLLTLCACSKQGAGQDGNDKTANMKVGKITAINGGSVTLLLGELSSPGGKRPDKSDSEGDGKRPEKPEGNWDGERPEMPEGFDGELPEMPEGGWDGERPEMPEGFDGERPEMPEGWDGERPEMPEGAKDSDGKPSGFPFGGMQMFKEGTETITVDLSGVKISSGSDAVSPDELEVGDILMLSYDSSGKIESASKVGAGRGFGGGKQP